MRRAALILNPVAGNAARFLAARATLEAVLADAGYGADWLPTTPEPQSARLLAELAVQRGTNLVLACGGDGTLHGVLQALKGTGVALGVLPAGTANAFARHFGIPLQPEQALRSLLQGQTVSLPLGRARTQSGNHWFSVMAGAGPDGMLAHALSSATKRRWGRSAYYASAARLFCTRRFAPFQVELQHPGGAWEQVTATAMMASRVENLGGIFRGLTPGCAPHHPHLRVHLLRSPAVLSLPAWFGLRIRSPWLRVVEAEQVRCTDLEASGVLAQLDGEPAGPLPLQLSMVPDSLRLLLPAAAVSDCGNTQA